jgi:hypothetical protein
MGLFEIAAKRFVGGCDNLSLRDLLQIRNLTQQAFFEFGGFEGCQDYVKPVGNIFESCVLERLKKVAQPTETSTLQPPKVGTRIRDEPD